MIKKTAVGAGVFIASALMAGGMAFAQTSTPSESPSSSPSPTVQQSTVTPSPSPSDSNLPSGAPVTGRGM